MGQDKVSRGVIVSVAMPHLLQMLLIQKKAQFGNMVTIR